MCGGLSVKVEETGREISASEDTSRRETDGVCLISCIFHISDLMYA